MHDFIMNEVKLIIIFLIISFILTGGKYSIITLLSAGSESLKIWAFIALFSATLPFSLKAVYRAADEWAEDNNFKIINIRFCRLLNCGNPFTHIIGDNYLIYLKDANDNKRAVKMRFGYGFGNIAKWTWLK